MSKNIFLLSAGEYGDMYGAALLDSLRDISGDIKAKVISLVKRPGYEAATLENLKEGAGDGDGEGRIHCLVVMDDQSLNRSFLKKARDTGAAIIYYGGGGALKGNALKKASSLIDLALAQFPSEADTLGNAGIKADFTGHPLIDIMETSQTLIEAKEAIGYDRNDLPVTVIPGDADEDLYRLMFEGAAEAAAVSCRKVRLIVPDSERYSETFINDLIKISPKRIKVLKSMRHEALRASDAALVGTGPATLEAAFAGAHILTVKRGSFLSNLFGNKDKFISLPNIILDKPEFPELSEKDVTLLRITQELCGLVEGSIKEEFDAAYEEVKERLGPPGTIRRAAEAICRVVEGN
ncbi:MAG: hypothetical protein ACE5DR_01550 [Thermodesulfobacteriota bacterium]